MSVKKPVYVVDIEGNGLIDDITKIHVLSYSHVSELDVTTLYTPEDIKEFLSQEGLVLIGHNFVTYDAQALKKVLGIEVNYRIIDTLAVAWYLESSSGRRLFGLESYGEELGVQKTFVDSGQWDGDINDPEFRQLMTDRCSNDVKINWLLWKKQQSYLSELYEKDSKQIHKLLDYLTFKMDCFREQMEVGFELDVEKCLEGYYKLSELSEEKTKALAEAMPKVPIKTVKMKPKVMYKQDGTLSARGEAWEELLKSEGLPEDTKQVEIITGWETGNPNSHEQVKKWLYDLGWEPKHIKHQRNKKTNEVKQIPQIASEFDKSEVCDSVKELIKTEPSVENLSGLSTINHRIGVLKGFLRDMKDGRIYQDIAGLTNTLRVRHKYLVNLPKPGNPYAEGIRACLLAGKDNLIAGCDLSGIEDSTKQHYIYPFDPEYVKDLQSSDYDAHTSVAVSAGLMTEDEERFFKWYSDKDAYSGEVTEGLRELQELPEEEQSELMSKLKDVRQSAKTVNFSATYSVGAKTLARTMKVTVKEAQGILDAYWKKNKSIKQFVASVPKKTVRGQMWVKQPVSGFWYSLRSEKDIFSTTNQSTAVYVFDTWLKYLRKSGVVVNYQSHDEFCTIFNKSKECEIREKVAYAIDKTNEELKLNVTIGCSMDVGINYLEVH